MASNAVIIPPGAPPMPPGHTSAPPVELRQIKGPVEIPNYWLYVWIVASLLIAAAAIYYFRKRFKKAVEAAPVPKIPPYQIARRQLEEALGLLGDPKAFTVIISDTLRQYLEGQFNLRAPERTTEEFLNELQTSRDLSAEQKLMLGDFLNQSDLIKFAKHEPNETALRGMHAAALKLVNETAPYSSTEVVRP